MKKRQLPIAFMSFAGKNCSMARFIAKVVYRVLCQTESIVICVGDWPLANILRVIVGCFTAQSVDNRFEIDQEVVQNLSKIDLGGRWKRVLEPNWLLEGLKSLRKTKTMVRGPPLAPVLGSHLRAQHDLEAVQKRFWRGLRCELLEKLIFEGCL